MKPLLHLPIYYCTIFPNVDPPSVSESALFFFYISRALPPRKIEVKHSMHGVSHAIPGEMDGIEKPLPVHYGVDQAIRSGSVALKAGRRQEFMSTESLTSIVKEPSLARGQSQDSIVHVRVTSPHHHLDIPAASISPVAKQVIPLRNAETESSEGTYQNGPVLTGFGLTGFKHYIVSQILRI